MTIGPGEDADLCSEGLIPAVVVGLVVYDQFVYVLRMKMIKLSTSCRKSGRKNIFTSREKWRSLVCES